jgi:site-specific DNA-methyltransferase (adenine-specific)
MEIITTEKYTLVCGDCLEYMQTMPDKSVDAVITDPPYHLKSIVKRFGKPERTPAQFGVDGAYSRHSTGFMGKEWDGGDIAHDPKTWEACLRIAKPGAFLLAFGGTRTFHRLACAIEDAGWEIRDCVMWVYGSGFPKSHNLKDEWKGWGTALKPAWEPIIVARKPVEGSVAENVLKYGTGAMNIDKSRIEGESIPINKLEEWSGFGQKVKPDYEQEINTKGRWPANLIHDGSEEVTELFPQARSSQGGGQSSGKKSSMFGIGDKGWNSGDSQYYDSGSAARFFYCAKASKEDRDEGLDGAQKQFLATMGNGIGEREHDPKEPSAWVKNNHPTVKPTALMRYLCNLVTQPNGKIFDPFMGSGSTGKAALMDGFNFIGTELDPGYFEIAKRRIEAAAAQMLLPLT